MFCLVFGLLALKGDNMTLHIILFIVSVFISANSQILLKISANRVYQRRLFEYLNKYVIFAYVLFSFSLILTTIAYRKVPLSFGFVIESLGIVFIAIISRYLFYERLSSRKILGYLIIIGGVIAIVY